MDKVGTDAQCACVHEVGFGLGTKRDVETMLPLVAS